jgi:DNA-binding beta-propeller fold protein YncE
MRPFPIIATLLSIGVLTGGHVLSAQAGGGTYHLQTTIQIGGEGGWDYVSTDPGKRLYVSHGTKVVVVDTAAGTVAGEIADTPGVHGIAVAPDLARLFVSAGRANSVAIVDAKTLQTTGKVATEENPDAILYEPAHHEVYAFNGRSHSATVIDGVSGEVRATIPLPGKPEFAVEDQAAGRIYNNIEDKNELVAIDTASHAVVATWPIAPGEEASGLAIDLAHHRLFIGCSNNLMEMMDSQSGKVLGSVPIGPGVDANAFDPGTGLAFASSSDGTLTVARVGDDGKLAVVQKLETPKRARTMTVDPATHRLYVPAADFSPPPADAAPGARPQFAAGSLRVMVYGMGE